MVVFVALEAKAVGSGVKGEKIVTGAATHEGCRVWCCLKINRFVIKPSGRCFAAPPALLIPKVIHRFCGEFFDLTGQRFSGHF